MIQEFIDTFRQYASYDDAEKYFIAHLVGHPWELIASISWLVVAFFCAWAVLSPRIQDTLGERIALACISIAATSRAIYIFTRGAVPVDGVFTALTIAIYCFVIYRKNVRTAREFGGRRCTDQEAKR